MASRGLLRPCIYLDFSGFGQWTSAAAVRYYLLKPIDRSCGVGRRPWFTALFVLLMSLPAFGEDWTRFRRPNGTGISPSAVIDDHGIASCVKADSGTIVYRQRVARLQTGGRPVYSSPVLAGDKIVLVTRWDGTLVLPAVPSFKILAQIRFGGDDTDFNATPAVSDGERFIRSNQTLYSVSSRK